MFLKKFLNYINIDTQSDDKSSTIPSTAKQKNLGLVLKNELEQLGAKDIIFDEFGYVYAFIPSNCKSQNTIGLIAHMDTSDEASGNNIKPKVIDKYDGKTITINEKLNLFINPIEYERLNKQVGHTLITTDGTTLLGADDKAGIAIIMTTCQELLNENKISYPNIIIAFTPDEEIGRGTNKFNYEYFKKYSCNVAYTLDGGEPEEINYENFNAASAEIEITGKSIHPGSAKNKMINSMLIAMEFNRLLPPAMTPEHTEGYEGFNHLCEINGSVSQTNLSYIIRNHDMNLFEKQKNSFIEIKNFLNKKYPDAFINLKIDDSYYNMHDKIMEKPEIIEIIKKALQLNNIEPIVTPIRGGTDGARLTFGGIYTPNLGTGGYNYHGPLEYLDVNESLSMIKVLKSLLSLNK